LTEIKVSHEQNITAVQMKNITATYYNINRIKGPNFEIPDILDDFRGTR
jgi:hypothetical protein